MAFLPHARRWRVLAVLVAWLLAPPRSGALQIATGHAEPGREICLDWTRKDGKNAEPADKRNNLGIPDRDQNRMQDARKEYGEILKTYRELARKDPEAYLPYVATTLNNLGISHQVKRLLHRDLARLHGFRFWQRNGQDAIVDFRADFRHIDRWIKFVDAPEIVRLDLPDRSIQQ